MTEQVSYLDTSKGSEFNGIDFKLIIDLKNDMR